MTSHPSGDRAPNPPLGYSRECHLTEAKQIRLVAEFHANRIRPSRIAYRLGIDIALVDALVAGEYQATLFSDQVALAQRRRRDQRVRSYLKSRVPKIPIPILCPEGVSRPPGPPQTRPPQGPNAPGGGVRGGWARAPPQEKRGYGYLGDP